MSPRNEPARVLIIACAWILGGVLTACSPALNWRETRVSGSSVYALFPCKPDAHVRRVALAGTELPMHMSSCAADGSVFAVSHVDVGDAQRVSQVLQALRTLAAGNIGAAATVIGAQQVPGMTPQPLAERLAMTGKRPDGSAIEVQAVFFAQAAVVYQASVVGNRLDTEAVDTFFAALKLR